MRIKEFFIGVGLPLARHCPVSWHGVNSLWQSISILILIYAATPSYASIYELDVHYGFGSSELSFNSVPGIAISIYQSKNLGISAGIEYSSHWVTKKSEQSGTNPITADSEGDSLIFKYDMQKYEEERNAKILQIPILLKYSGKNFYTSAGVKIGVVQNPTAKSKYENLTTEAYYPQYDLTLTAPQYQGFGAQNDSSFKTKIEAKNLFMLALEGGTKVKINENFDLLAGIFADYSFTKGFDRKLPPFIERVENPAGGANLKISDKWGSWRPWALGVQVKISFKAKIDNSVESEPESPPPPPAPAKPVAAVPNIVAPTPIIIAPPPPPLAPSSSSVEQAPPKINIVLPVNTLFATPSLPPELSGEPQFVFYYPETRTSPTDSLHLKTISQIADAMRKDTAKLHCVGYSEKLLSESAAYESAFQRALRIKYTLYNFYGISQDRIFTYSQGSKIPPRRAGEKSGASNRRAECYLIEK